MNPSWERCSVPVQELGTLISVPSWANEYHVAGDKPMSRLRRVLLSERSLLLMIWFLATACNLDKAYHIDDTAYLETAEWIAEHPTTPMTGLVNWSWSAEPIHYMNQPPLYSYLLAGWGMLFGYGEIPMHALQSLFTLVVVFFFFGIARMLAPSYSLTFTALLVLGPAFLVGQNLMVDVPALA